MRSLRAQLVAPPAPLADGEVVLAYDVTAGGEIGVLVTTEPGLARGFVTGPHGNRLPFYRPPRPCPAVLYRYESPDWHRVELDGLPVSYPMLALLPRDEVLVACPRTPWIGERDEPRNAHVFSPDGAHLRTFTLGDDIDELVVDDAGTIWTAHGEEGYFSLDSHSGLIRWDGHGKRMWDSGIACSDTAVNAHAGTVWAYREPGSSLIRAQLDGLTGRPAPSGFDATIEYESPSPRVHAIAFTDDRLLLADPDIESLWCELGDAVQEIDTAQVVDSAGQAIDYVVLRSHGSRVYLRDYGDGWLCVDIAE